MTEQKQQLETQLWNIANTLRGKMDADDFRDYILGFIFYKYLSRKMELYANEILEPDNLTFEALENHAQADEYLDAVKGAALDKLGYFLKPSELFSELAKRGNSGGKEQFILGDLGKVLTSIEQSTMGSESEEDFGNLFEDLDLTSSKLGKSENDKNGLIVKVLSHLDLIDFDLENTESDVLGDAYEYLIGKFASGAGKTAGEFYTPQQVSSVLAQLVTVGKEKLRSVYDPTCGSGSLLLRVAKEVKEVVGFYGQEMNPTTYNLCRMNMIMHDVHYKKFDIKNEDTLERPQHLDQTFEAIVANPPFSAKWSASPLFISDDRFSNYGKLAPSSKADFAFVQHMVHHLDDNGTMAVVLPHGVLFRGAAEGHIRKYLIKDCNYLDAVIGLPANIFYGTNIPTCILVLRKKRDSQSEKVLFIDASQHFEKVKTQNMLRAEDIDKIITTYGAYRNSEWEEAEIEKYSHVAALEEIAENDYNLNIPRYVDTFEEEEPVDLAAVSKELKEMAGDLAKTDASIAAYCKELGIEPPF
ncbi:type I restriction-modification system subunit M [Arcticibacterium luteifluviistationis]|uniref:site-specific DNA-methyltransferase (adenine-specific) n=1 Tax=Arcticibacterium luteifluviistationis TaxID=1784714 RepID=A0A2Z4G9E6_9BACT|nr:type I restriction-modification system subunit M [Arcticibacterium luteifluviistationis]AWV97700.1 type I restriction-modification system subunit M [Arcticibacterium luteifluviistationis]